MKANPAGPSDQLSCELLSLYFVERPKAASRKPPPSRIRRPPARSTWRRSGSKPAAIRPFSPHRAKRSSPAQSGWSTVCRANSLGLDGGQEVFLQQGPNEIHARSLYYESRPPARGVWAGWWPKGPVSLHGQSADRPDQQLEALWKDKLRVFPDEQNQVISLTGGAELKFPGVGQLQAREIFFWLLEAPPAAKNQPRRCGPTACGPCMTST